MPLRRGWSGGAKLLDKLAMRDVLHVLMRIIEGQGPIVHAVGAGGDVLTFFRSSIFSVFFLPLGERVRYKLKYFSKGR